jgi:hypothetical protein
VRDQIDMLAIPAIDGAQHALAQPRGVLDDPVEHRLDAVGASEIRLKTSAVAACRSRAS